MWNNSIRPKIALFQAILFCLIVASGTVFMHKHKTADGRIVIHTHPYNLNKDPDATKHHHSDTEIHLLDVIFHGNFIQPQFTHYVQPVITPIHVAYLPYRARGLETKDLHYAYLRGPPQSV
ncbi:hypothetical protein [Parapedobacter sp. DT-150]|uniref:hypothetical protein n=1 Tax=Parapedobacter sp. DT-150 TaxID=3396162 RepID=UPI003F1C6164